MRACLFVVFGLLACSNGNSPTDGGTDAANVKDSAADSSPADSSNDTGNDGGCSATGTATITGMLLGSTMAAKDAMSTSDSNGPFFVVTDYANVCAIGPSNVKASSSTLLFSLLSGSAFTAKTYNVPTDVDVAYATWDATCNSPTGESGFGGTVTVTQADACGLQGTFDVTFNSDHITGTFTAPACTPAAADAGTGCK